MTIFKEFFILALLKKEIFNYSFGILEPFFKIAKRLYGELDERLSSSKYLAGNDYTIADIATWPWFARHEWHDIGLNNYKNLTRWYLDIASREAVIKGYDLFKNGSKIPKP